jgi:hypothetical protein
MIDEFYGDRTELNPMCDGLAKGDRTKFTAVVNLALQLDQEIFIGIYYIS